MTPLRQRMIEDMCLRNFAGTTQRSYIHYVAEFAKYFNRSPQELDLEAVRQYQLHLTQERKLSPQSVNTFRFRRTVPLPGHPGDALGQARLPACPPGGETTRRAGPRRSPTLPGPRLGRQAPRRAPDLLWGRTAHLRGGGLETLRYRWQTQADPRGTRQRRQGSLRHALTLSARGAARLLPHPAACRRVAVSPPGARSAI